MDNKYSRPRCLFCGEETQPEVNRDVYFCNGSAKDNPRHWFAITGTDWAKLSALCSPNPDELDRQLAKGLAGGKYDYAGK